MNKIDEQPNRGSHTVGGGVDASTQGAPSLPGSQPIASGTADFRALDQRSEPNDLLQTVSSKTTSRRAWLRRGVAVASPVVATLASAPVFGADCLNLNPSGFVSAATFASRHPGQTVCAFLGPNFWIKDSRLLTNGVFDKTFEKLFGTAVEAAISGARPKPTLYAVLSGGTTYTVLAKYSIAAYLNASVNTANFPLSTQDARDVYHSYFPGPVKTPPLVAGWNVGQTESWLAMLMSRSS